MNLNISYDCGASLILDDAAWSQKSRAMKRAGVDRMWIQGYFYGGWESDPEDIWKAKKRLEEDGFATGIINLPFGHGSNALNPDDASVRLVTGEGWRPRFNSKGQPIPATTCVNDKMIADTKEAVSVVREMGFKQVFYDDDLRYGSWGEHLQGCFCPDCIERFSKAFFSVSLADFESPSKELFEAWCTFQCEAIANFVSAVTLPGIETGVMVMHNGDRRHGIDIPLLKERVPGIFFRVGEGHFNDGAFEHPLGHQSLLTSIHNHMALVGNADLCYSESTVFPKNFLTPANLVQKIRLEIEAGLRNIFLMSGTIFLDEPYWEALEAARSLLLALAENTLEPLHPIREPIWQI